MARVGPQVSPGQKAILLIADLRLEIGLSSSIWPKTLGGNRMNAIPVLLCLLLTACGIERSYYKPDMSKALLDQDLKQCQYEARKATECITYPSDPAEAAMFAGDERERLVQHCMEARGYAMGAPEKFQADKQN
jgi:hypothetical protein